MVAGAAEEDTVAAEEDEVAAAEEDEEAALPEALSGASLDRPLPLGLGWAVGVGPVETAGVAGVVASTYGSGVGRFGLGWAVAGAVDDDDDDEDDDDEVKVGAPGRVGGSVSTATGQVAVASWVAVVAEEAAAAAAAAEEAAVGLVGGARADTAGIPVVSAELEDAMAVGNWASGTSASATLRWGAFQTSEEKRCITVRTTRLQGSRASVDRRVWMVAGLSRIVGRPRMRRSRWSSNEEAYARALLAAAVPVSQ